MGKACRSGSLSPGRSADGVGVKTTVADGVPVGVAVAC